MDAWPHCPVRTLRPERVSPLSLDCWTLKLRPRSLCETVTPGPHLHGLRLPLHSRSLLRLGACVSPAWPPATLAHAGPSAGRLWEAAPVTHRAQALVSGTAGVGTLAAPLPSCQLSSLGLTVLTGNGRGNGLRGLRKQHTQSIWLVALARLPKFCLDLGAQLRLPLRQDLL